MSSDLFKNVTYKQFAYTLYTGCLNIYGTHVTANNSTTNNIGCLNIHGTHVTANNSTNNIGCLNIHGTHVTANNSTTNNIVLFLVSDLKKYTITTINPRSQYLGQEKNI